MYSEIEMTNNINDIDISDVTTVNLQCSKMNRNLARECEFEYACMNQTQKVCGIECVITTDDYDELCNGCAIYEELLQVKKKLEATGKKVTLFA